MLKTKKNKFNGDRLILFIPLALSFFGLGVVFNASSATALANFQNKYYFFNKQVISLSIGLFSFFFFSFFDYRKIKKFSFFLLLINLVFLILVFIPGIGREVYGGKRWLSFGFFGFQPAELSKLTLVLYLPVLLEKNKKLSIFLFLIGLFSLLIMLEPDLGTTVIVVATAFCLYFLSGASIKNLLITVFLGLVSIPILIVSSGYRRKRFMEFINSSLNNEASSYHLRQVLISLGSGGFWGRGFGQSRQKFLFLPEAATDSIFAIIAEEFGFLGASSIVIIFIVLLARGLKISAFSLDYYGKMVCAGIIFFISLQAFVNLSSVVSLIPITGVPLPFVSYGGSSLIVSLTGMGIVYNISRRTDSR